MRRLVRDRGAPVVRIPTADFSALKQAQGGGRVRFPLKLHMMLQECKDNGDEGVVGWLPCGTAFRVRNKKEFTSRIMPRYCWNLRKRNERKILTMVRPLRTHYQLTSRRMRSERILLLESRQAFQPSPSSVAYLPWPVQPGDPVHWKSTFKQKKLVFCLALLTLSPHG